MVSYLIQLKLTWRPILAEENWPGRGPGLAQRNRAHGDSAWFPVMGEVILRAAVEQWWKRDSQRLLCRRQKIALLANALVIDLKSLLSVSQRKGHQPGEA